MRNLAPLMAVPVGILYAIGLVLVIINVIARVGGWHALSKAWSTERMPTGQAFRMQSGALRWPANYNNCLNVVLTADGFGMQPFFPFRIGHPPLFIPFRAMSGVQPCSFLWANGVSLYVDGHCIRVYGRAGKSIIERWRAWHLTQE